MTSGVVAAGDPQTARAGARLLEQGGNAVDAAVAAGFAAFVCELPLCSPLGGGAMLLERPGEKPHALDLFARTPGLDTQRPAHLDFADVEVSFGAASQVFHVGRGSAAVPLALPGLLEAHRRWGSRPLEEVLAPAIELGRAGYVLNPGVAFVFQVLTPIISRTPECRALFSDGDEIARVGARLTNTDLAATLEDLVHKPDLVRDLYCALARELGPKEGGLITERDVEAAVVMDRPPVSTSHAGWDLVTMPPPSTGGVLVALGLRLHAESRHPFGSPEQVLDVARIQERLLEVRGEDLDRIMIDPTLVQELLSDAGIERLKKNALGSTTHLSVLDEHGGAVALTLTNGESSGHVVSGTGMVVNNLLGEEDIHPRGFHHDPPGAPLATMMAPTILSRGTDRIALGSGGSNRLRTAILQVLVGLVEHGTDADVAVRAPRIHLEPGPRLAFEAADLAPEARSALTARYPDDPRCFEERNLYFGGVHVAERRGGVFSGAGDPRRGGAVVLV